MNANGPKKKFALIDVAPVHKTNGEVNHVKTPFSAMRVLGVCDTEREAWELSQDLWDCSNRQKFHVVPLEVYGDQ